MSTLDAGGIEFRMLPDSPEYRLLVELASCGNDLHEAADSIDFAIGRQLEGALPSVAERALIDHATVAYCRAIDPQKFPRRLTDFVEIPAESRELHDLIRQYRNNNVAHSKAELSSTLIEIPVEPENRVTRSGVTVLTLIQPIPADIVDAWRSLIDVLLTQLDEQMEVVSHELEMRVAATLVSEVLAWPMGPAIQDRMSEEFDPKVPRVHYTQTLRRYWSSKTLD